MRSFLSFVSVCVFCLCCGSASADVFLSRVVGRLTEPLQVTNAGDGSGRLFIVEKGGKIRIFNGSRVLRRSFLDISGLVSDGGEQGLLSVAFHPNFENNRKFYINYTNLDGNTVVAEYLRRRNSGNLAVATANRRILQVSQPFSNHNGGLNLFGPDGYLYIAMGDGGSGGDPGNRAQNLGSLLGKILRIDINQGRRYAIPPDNPFVNTPGARREIFAYGLRNPWRCSFDFSTDRLFCGDVGQGTLEEIDIIESGKNYGWRVMEGTECFSPSSGCDQSSKELPISEYGRTAGQAVTGGYVYRGTMAPSLAGKYIFGDFLSGRIWALTEQGGGSWTRELVQHTDLLVSSFGEDEAGELYVVDFRGAIFRFEEQ